MTDQPAPVLSAAEIAAMVARHRPHDFGYAVRCFQCEEACPCDAARLAASHAAVEGELERQTRLADVWAAAAADVLKRAQAAEAERDQAQAEVARLQATLEDLAAQAQADIRAIVEGA